MENAVISGWCSVADMENAMRVYRKMREVGVSSNLRTFETLIWGYSEQKQPWKAEEVLQMMQEAGVRPKQSTYCLIADAWKAVGLVENANRALGSSSDDDRRHANDESDHSDHDDDKLQRFERSDGQAKSDASHSSFLQVTSALGSSGLVSGKILKARDFASKSLQAVKKTSSSSSLRRSCQLRLRSSGFFRKQFQKQGGLYSQSINSFKMVFLI